MNDHSIKPGAKWDPNLSEAYKALQEEGDDRVSHVSQPTRQGVFSPQRPRQSRVRFKSIDTLCI